jgi:hypothetical protein
MDPILIMLVGPMVTALLIVAFALYLVRRERAEEKKNRS